MELLPWRSVLSLIQPYLHLDRVKKAVGRRTIAASYIISQHTVYSHFGWRYLRSSAYIEICDSTIEIPNHIIGINEEQKGA